MAKKNQVQNEEVNVETPVVQPVSEEVPPMLEDPKHEEEVYTDATSEVNQTETQPQNVEETEELPEEDVVTQPEAETQPAQPEVKVRVVPVETPFNIGADRANYEKTLRAKWAKEPRVEFEIPLGIGEEYGSATLTVKVGGVLYGKLPKGELISAPKSIYLQVTASDRQRKGADNYKRPRLGELNELMNK